MSEEVDAQDEMINEIMDESAVEDTPDEVVEEEVVEEEAAEATEEVVEDARTVPLAALHEARAQNQELREAMARRDERMAMIQERLDEMARPAEAPAEEEIEVPAFEEDPAGHFEARFAKLEQLLAKSNEAAQQTAQSAQQTDMQRQLDSAIQADQGEFVQTHPDYAEALAYERQRQLQQLMDGGLNEENARAAISQSEYQMASIVLTNKKSPAEVMYNAAVRAGYVPKTEEGSAVTGKDDEEIPDKSDADTMGASGGPSVQDLLNADTDEFDEMFNELGYGKKMQ